MVAACVGVEPGMVAACVGVEPGIVMMPDGGGGVDGVVAFGPGVRKRYGTAHTGPEESAARCAEV